MKKILLFAGTTEGRMLSEYLSAAEIYHTVCVATEYGEIVLKESPYALIRQGRMEQQEIREFILEEGYAAIVDATHPYAVLVTENIKAARKDLAVPYFRLRREFDGEIHYDKITYFGNHEACASALLHIQGNILLTIGSKELQKYSHLLDLKERLYVRVLPSEESISSCRKQGICPKQILALFGPFSEAFNEAMIHQYQIRCLVTKESGRSGGYPEKIRAAEKAGIPVFVIGNPRKEDGLSFEEICRRLENICCGEIKTAKPMEIILAGVGMGNTANLTKEVSEAIEKADILLGAERMIQKYTPRIAKQPYYQPQQITAYLIEVQRKYSFFKTVRTVILFSGDSGFYSGCKNLYKKLSNEIKQGNLNAILSVCPGISSVAYLAACVGESYQDAAVRSIHGKKDWKGEILHTVRHNEKTFLLLSGVEDVRTLGQMLCLPGFSQCTITAGYQLSYPNQEILQLSPEECKKAEKEGLYTCFVQNGNAQPLLLSPQTKDGQFIRDRVPMTKEEVREVVICKLRLREHSIVYDIGSGTGSIAVEIAGLSPKLQVYAIEKNEAAITLMEKNREKFQAYNMTIVKAEAPEKFDLLPTPGYAFIGGSGGRLKEILSILYQKNPNMRIVLNAVSLETICEMKECLSLYPMKEEDAVQLQVSRANQIGAYHLMQAYNPVWIYSFTFRAQNEE